jgi:hypothetical protein
MEKVSITRFLKEEKRFLKKYDEFIQKLVEINKAGLEKEREKLVKQYGIYTSIINCPYYCIVTNKEQLLRVFEGNKEGNYKYCSQHLDTFKHKYVQDEARCGKHGKFIGLGFFVDEIYFVFSDSETGKEHMCLNLRLYDKYEDKPYRLVTNDKGYI